MQMAGTQQIGIAALTELALNLRWSCHRGKDGVTKKEGRSHHDLGSISV